MIRNRLECDASLWKALTYLKSVLSQCVCSMCAVLLGKVTIQLSKSGQFEAWNGVLSIKTLCYEEETKIFLGDMRQMILFLMARAEVTHDIDVSISEVSVVLLEVSNL